jgi:hypothetical protein
MAAESSLLAGLSHSQPVSMTSGDLDADGFEDLVVGYSTGSGGFISIHRGNIDAFAPQSDASFQAIGRGEFPSPFLLEAKVFSVPVSPDFIALGNFIGGGNKDLAVAAQGGSVLYIFPGDREGNFGAPQTVDLADGVTALAAGDFGGSHMPALIVGMSRSLAVYVSTAEGLSELASLPLAAPPSNILFGEFGDPGPDVAFLSGGKVQILRSSNMQLATVSLPVPTRAFALGSFLYDRNGGSQIALIAPDGSVQIAVRNEFDPRTYTLEEFRAIRRAKLTEQPSPSFVPALSFPGNGWKIIESFPGAASLGAGQAPLVFRTRVSINGADDVMVLNAFSGRLTLISHPDLPPGAQTFLPGQVSLRPYSGTPIMALPMRVNVDGRPGVMALHRGEIAPSMIMPIPDPTYTVNRTDDPTPASPITSACNGVANDCSLREAILRANGDTVMVPAGTYTLSIAKVANDCTGNFGALSAEHTVTITGAGQNSTIIQAGTTAYSAGTANGVDMVLNVNEDLATTNCPVTNATASISNLTLQNGHNRGTQGWDGDGGCMEFDTGTNGTATLTLTNVTLQNCDTTQGNGGGLANFNYVVPTGSGQATISNSIIQGNTASTTLNNNPADGGGIFVTDASRITMTSSQVLNNVAKQIGTGSGFAGGLYILSKGTPGQTPQTQIHSSTISGNQAAFQGGGIWDTANLLIDQGTVIINNKNGQSGTAVDGGGLFINGPASLSITLTGVTITGNQSTGTGGGISAGAGGGTAPVTISFSRFAGNTAGTTGSNLENLGSVITATDNWWGTNAPSGTIHTSAGTTTFAPFIVLTHTASPDKIHINQSSTLTGDMSKDSNGNAVGLSNLTEIIGLPITFDSPTLGATIPQAQPETLNSSAQATATFNAGGTGGLGSAHATVDQAVVPVDSNLIASATEAGTTATITTVGAHNFIAGNQVTITGALISGYNGTFIITSVNPPLQFSYTDSIAGLGSSSGGSASIGLVVLQPPTISKAFNPTSIPRNGTTTLTFTISNPNTTTDLSGVSFSDTLPVSSGSGTATLVVSSTPSVSNTCGGTVTATAGSGVISLSGGSVTHNTSCTLTVNVTGTVEGDGNNTTGAISSTEGGTGTTSNTATLKVVTPPAISKAFGAANAALNGTTTLTFTITNPASNTSAENGIAFSDTLTNGLQVASTPGVSNTCGGTVTAAANSTSISLTGGSIATPGSTCTIVVNVTGTQTGVVSNTTGAVSSTNGGTGATSNTATLMVASPETVTNTFAPTKIPLNGTALLTINITNPNSSVTLTGLAFTDSLPAGLVVASTPSLSNTCGGTATATAGSSSLSLSGGTLAASASCAVSVNVQGTTAGDKLNSVQVSSTEGGTSTTANATVTVVAPPAISKGFGAGSIPRNGTSTLTFTISNPNNPGTPANGDLTGVAFSDTLPVSSGPGTATLVVSSTPNVSNTCGGTVTATAGSGVISLSGGSVAHNTSCTLSVDVKGTVEGDGNNTTGAISSTEGGTGTASNTATLKVVTPPAISKAFGAANITLNGTTTLTFTITNPASNTSAENGIAFSDTLTNGLQVASTPGVSNTCGGTVTAAANSTSISLTGGSIATPGSPCTIVVNVTGTQTGAVSNTTGAVSSTNGGAGATSNTATLMVASPATVTKTFAPTKIPLNGTTLLTINITNPNSNVTLTGLALTDSLPAGLVAASTPSLSNTCGGTATATAGSSAVSLSGGTLAASASCAVSVNVQGTTAGDKLNSVQVSSTEGGTSTTANATVTVVAPPAISKAFGAGSIPRNGTTTLTFTISNPNNPGTPANGDLTGVSFSDTLPVSGGPASATLVISSTPNVSNTCGGTVTATAGSGVISLSGSSVAHNTSCTLSVDVKGTVEGDGNNTTSAISSTEGGTGTTSNIATLKVVVPPAISKAFGAANITLNGTTTVTFTITNPASNTSAENGIAFSDTLTNGLQVASTPGVSNTCGGTVTAAANSTSISLAGGSIATPGSPCTIVVNVTGTQSGAVSNTTSAVSSVNGGTGATSNTATLFVASPQAVTKTFAPTKIPLNGTTLLTINITNPNSNVTLTGLAFTDSLPAGLVIASTPSLSNTCGGTATATAGSSAVSLSGGTLASSASCAVSVNVQGTTAGDKLNSVQVSSTEGGTSTTANAAVTVVAPPTISKGFNPASIPRNGTSTLTFTISNPNNPGTPANGDLTGVAFSDTLPASSGPGSATLVVSSTPNVSNTCGGTVTATAGSGLISLSGGSVAHNTSCTLSVDVKGTVEGDGNNTTGAISSTEGGTGTASNTATLKVIAPPLIASAFSPGGILPNGASTLTITITNPAANTAALQGVAFTDSFPASVVVATPNGLGNTCGGTATATAGSGTVSLTGGTIATTSSCSVSVNVTSSTPGLYTNTTGAVSSTNGGTGSTATAALGVQTPSLSITKTHVGNFSRNSTNDNYTITVSASATAGPTAGTVTVTDTLPNVANTLVPTSMTGSGWTCTLATLTCTRSDPLAPGASYPPITLTVTVPAGIPANITNSATVSGGGDPNSHTANDPTHIGAPIAITLASSAITVNVGGTQFVNFTVDSSAGEGTINFACSGLPFGATCSFNPPSTNQLSTTVTMGVTASAGTASVLPLGTGRTQPPLYAAVLLGFVGLGISLRKGKTMRVRLAVLLAAMALALAFVGCGGGMTTPPTPKGTYQVTVTATSTTGDSGSAVLTMTVPQ